MTKYSTYDPIKYRNDVSSYKVLTHKRFDPSKPLAKGNLTNIITANNKNIAVYKNNNVNTPGVRYSTKNYPLPATTGLGKNNITLFVETENVYIEPSKLSTYGDAQREINQPHLFKLVENFDFDSCREIEVIYDIINDIYWIIDGNHRATACYVHSNTPIRAMVYKVDPTQCDMAILLSSKFLKLNGGRLVDQTTIGHLESVTGVPAAVSVRDLKVQHNIVSKISDKTNGKVLIKRDKSLRKMVDKFGPAVVDDAILFYFGTFGKIDIDHKIFGGLAIVINHFTSQHQNRQTDIVNRVNLKKALLNTKSGIIAKNDAITRIDQFVNSGNAVWSSFRKGDFDSKIEMIRTHAIIEEYNKVASAPVSYVNVLPPTNKATPTYKFS